MNITRLAIQNNRVSYMVYAVIVVLGILSYNQLSRNSMPPFTIRICSVVTQFPGASPERMESLITERIEQVAQEIPELKNVTSESRTNLSIVNLEVTPDIAGEDLQLIWDRLRRKIDNIRDELPEGIKSLEIKDDGVGVVYGIMLGMRGEGFSNRELKDMAEDIRDDLIKLPDASEIHISGVQEEQIFVEFDNAKLSEIGLTSGQLRNIIAATNIVFPGGEVSLENERIVLEPTGNFENLEDLYKTLIPIGNTGRSVQLGDITRLKRGYKAPAERIVRVNGEPGLAISIALKDGANLIQLGQIIDQKIITYNQSLPIGVSIIRSAYQDYYVQNKVEDFVGNVVQSIVIVLLVMLLFLGLRTGLVVASLIPMAMILTLLLMNFFDLGLNQVSLAALIMALGMLVDNAIVVSESMMVKMENGSDPLDAAIASSKELMIPLLVSSLTTSAAFLAFFLAEDTMGEIMGPLFSVITLALLSSWILAMTMVTMLGVTFMRVKQKSDQASSKSIFTWLQKYYQKIIVKALRHPIIFLLAIIVLFFGSLSLFPKLPFIFFPDSDRNLVTLDLNLPLGTKIEETQNVVDQIESYIREYLVKPESPTTGITDWTTFVGEGPESYDLGYQPGEANSGYAHMLLNTASFAENERVSAALDSFCFVSFPDAQVSVGPLAGGGGGGADIAIRISGDSPEVLSRISGELRLMLNAIEGTKNIKDDWGPKIKKFIIDIDQDKANRANLTNQDIAISLQTSLSGSNAGAFREGKENIGIFMRNENSLDLDVRELGGLNIFSQSTGRNVPLVQVAQIIPDWQYAKILRRNLFRTLTVQCNAVTGFTASGITEALRPKLSELSKSWPENYTYTLGGESEQSNEAMGAVGAKLPLAAFIILILLISQFNSFRKTFIVLSTIPLGLIGVILGLYFFDSYFGFMAFLGIISLAGIVINNAIVLLDRIMIEMTENGRTEYMAILAACDQRFRPILLTTFTTTLGLIPLYLGGGLMWEPMAISIMIGLLFATVITLLFVPVLYKLLFKVKAEISE